MVGERKDESAPEARNLSRKAIRLGCYDCRPWESKRTENLGLWGGPAATPPTDSSVADFAFPGAKPLPTPSTRPLLVMNVVKQPLVGQKLRFGKGHIAAPRHAVPLVSPSSGKPGISERDTSRNRNGQEDRQRSSENQGEGEAEYGNDNKKQDDLTHWAIRLA
jgi:hypothetical protein